MKNGLDEVLDNDEEMANAAIDSDQEIHESLNNNEYEEAAKRKAKKQMKKSRK